MSKIRKYCEGIDCAICNEKEPCIYKIANELEEKLLAKEQECQRLKDKLNCCFCTPYVELNDIEKQRKCVEVTECFRRQLDQLKAENDTLFKAIEEVNKINKKLKSKNEELKGQLTILDDETIVVEITEKQFEEYQKLKAKNEELKKINKHIEHNRKQKADKLMRIEKLIIACSTGYTDEFIQELLVILHEPEPNSFENKYKQALTEIKEIAEENDELLQGYHKEWANNKIILEKISEVEDV